MSNLPTKQEGPQLSAELMQQVLVYKNTKGLKAEQKLQFLNALCSSLGMNPLSSPIDFLQTKDGREIPYVKRDGTDQLRKNYDVSVTIASREVTNGVYVVTAQAKLPSGRVDEAIGAVAIDGLKGEPLSNAMMKTETKAKRRVTLSICGLGMLDESEIESVPGALIATPATEPLVPALLIAQPAESQDAKPEQSETSPAPASTFPESMLARKKGDGVPGDYKITMGKKYRDLTMKEAVDKFGVKDIESYCDWLTKTSIAKGYSKPSPEGGEFIQKFNEYRKYLWDVEFFEGKLSEKDEAIVEAMINDERMGTYDPNRISSKYRYNEEG